jgi:periplasmic protein TonB
MFQNYVDAKAEKRRGWMSIFIAISVAIHVVGIAALLIRSFWVITPLEPPDTQIALAAPPPPPPPPPPASETPERIPDKVYREVDRTVQPDPDREIPEDIVTEEQFEGIMGGVEGGIEGGVMGGVQGGLAGGIGDPPPAPPSEPKVIPDAELDARRVAGNRNILPDSRTQTRMQRDGRDMVTGVIRMCLTPAGSVDSLNVVRSTGYSDYDNRLLSEMRQWRYQLNEAIPVCTTVTFNYRQRH